MTPHIVPSYSLSAASRTTSISAESRTKDTDFNYILYGVNDRGQVVDGERRSAASGYLMSFDGRSDLKRRWSARADVNYLSSFDFRQSFHRVVLRSYLFRGTHGGAPFKALGYLLVQFSGVACGKFPEHQRKRQGVSAPVALVRVPQP